MSNWYTTFKFYDSGALDATYRNYSYNWKEAIEELNTNNPDLGIYELHSSSDYSQYGENHALRDCERATWFAVLDGLKIDYITLRGVHDTVVIIAALTQNQLYDFADYLDNYPMVDHDFASDLGVSLDDHEYSEYGFAEQYAIEALDFEVGYCRNFVGQPPTSSSVFYNLPDNWNDWSTSYPSDEHIVEALTKMGYTLDSDSVWIEPPTIVIYRTWKETDNVLAVFPEISERSTNYPERDRCSSYGRGGHGGCDYVGILPQTTLATPDEYTNLHKELTAIGYNLIVRKRETAAMRNKRLNPYT